MRRLKVREVDLINEYFEAEQDADGDDVVATRTQEENRAETERRKAARIELQAELDAAAEGEAVDG
jgi:hypothetical protein